MGERHKRKAPSPAGINVSRPQAATTAHQIWDTHTVPKDAPCGPLRCDVHACNVCAEQECRPVRRIRTYILMSEHNTLAVCACLARRLLVCTSSTS